MALGSLCVQQRLGLFYAVAVLGLLAAFRLSKRLAFVVGGLREISFLNAGLTIALWLHNRFLFPTLDAKPIAALNLKHGKRGPLTARAPTTGLVRPVLTGTQLAPPSLLRKMPLPLLPA